ncbi:hypothetical protein JOF41_001040 [Saccharothrix coeruleofusca]|nr:hypothetical protein [Saccharothrix coeruleofusca]
MTVPGEQPSARAASSTPRSSQNRATSTALCLADNAAIAGQSTIWSSPLSCGGAGTSGSSEAVRSRRHHEARRWATYLRSSRVRR